MNIAVAGTGYVGLSIVVIAAPTNYDSKKNFLIQALLRASFSR